MLHHRGLLVNLIYFDVCWIPWFWLTKSLPTWWFTPVNLHSERSRGRPAVYKDRLADKHDAWDEAASTTFILKASSFPLNPQWISNRSLFNPNESPINPQWTSNQSPINPMKYLSFIIFPSGPALFHRSPYPRWVIWPAPSAAMAWTSVPIWRLSWTVFWVVEMTRVYH